MTERKNLSCFEDMLKRMYRSGDEIVYVRDGHNYRYTVLRTDGHFVVGASACSAATHINARRTQLRYLINLGNTEVSNA